MNENFINTWVPNSELGRVPSLRDPIDKRREREGKTFDTSHALAQAIMKGWKKHSPVDCLIISPEFEVMGRQPVNELFGADMSKRYLTFLKLALDGKYPGFRESASAPQPTDWKALIESGNIIVDDLKAVLTDEKSTQQITSAFRTPERGYQDYTVVEIDATAFKDGGWLIIDIGVGDAEASGSFDLFDGNWVLPTEGMPRALASAWDIPPNESGIIEHYFYKGQIFKLGATGNWFSEKGSLNGFMVKISVEPVSETENED